MGKKENFGNWQKDLEARANAVQEPKEPSLTDEVNAERLTGNEADKEIKAELDSVGREIKNRPEKNMSKLDLLALCRFLEYMGRDITATHLKDRLEFEAAFKDEGTARAAAENLESAGYTVVRKSTAITFVAPFPDAVIDEVMTRYQWIR